MGGHTGSSELQKTLDRHTNSGGQDTVSCVPVSWDPCIWGEGIVAGVEPLRQFDN